MTPRLSRRRRRTLTRAGLYAAAALVVLVSVFPVLWMIGTSVKPDAEISSADVRLVPAHPTLEHYGAIFNSDGVGGVSLWIYLRNSLVVALATVLLGSLLALLAATAVARFRFRFRTTFLILLLIVQMVPAEALLIPLFIQVRRVGLYDQLAGLVAVNVALTLPFAIWMLRTFVAAVPRELEEAARIDGASQFRTFWSVLFPLVAPGLVATSIFSFITAWNEFIFALTLINDPAKRTLPLSLSWFVSREGTDWGPIMAASTVMTVPVVAFFLFVQRRMVSGLVAGAVKG